MRPLPGEETRWCLGSRCDFLLLRLTKGQAVAMCSASLVCVSKCRPEEQSAPRLVRDASCASALSGGALCVAGGWLSVCSPQFRSGVKGLWTLEPFG